MIDIALRALLLTHTPLTTVVGAQGVFLQHAAQGAPLPYVLLLEQDSEEFNSLDAPSGSFRSVEFEIDSKGRTAAEASTLAETLRLFLKDYRGVAGTQVIDAIYMQERFADVERPFQGSDQKTHVVTLRLLVQYHPA